MIRVRVGKKEVDAFTRLVLGCVKRECTDGGG